MYRPHGQAGSVSAHAAHAPRDRIRYIEADAFAAGAVGAEVGAKR